MRSSVSFTGFCEKKVREKVRLKCYHINWRFSEQVRQLLSVLDPFALEVRLHLVLALRQ